MFYKTQINVSNTKNSKGAPFYFIYIPIGGTRSPIDRHIDKKNAPLHNKKCIPHYLLCHLSINFEFPYIDTVFCRTKVLKFLFVLLFQI